MDLALYRYNDVRLPPDFKAARSRLAGQEHNFTAPLNHDFAAGYAPVNDLSGRPALVLRVKVKRDIYKQGEKTVRYFLFSLFAITVILGAVFTLFLEKTVLSRLVHLSASVKNIGTIGNLSARITLSGKDELAGLARDMNGMLSELEVAQDERKRREALIQSEERYRGLVEHSPDAVLISSDNVCVFTNAAGVRLFGAGVMGEIIGMRLADAVVPARRSRFENYIREALEGRVMLEVEEKIVRLDGGLVDVEIAAIPFIYQEKEAVQVILHDITERKRFEEKISYMAYYDGLTGLPNRLLLYDRLGQAINTARRNDAHVAILFLDLDNFKRINDTLGQTTGDKLLKSVGERLAGILRPGDSVAHLGKGEDMDFVSRLGGDEFVVMLTDIDGVNGSGKVAQRVLDAMTQPFRLDDHELFVTTSIGITLFPFNGEDPDTLLKNADVAMYKAKDLGRNNFQFYAQSMNEMAYERLVIENNLRTAIKREEFLLHYQPQYNIKDRELTGVEALVRWQHGEKGLIPPGDFIPIAEENGLIIPIGEWVLRTACSQSLVWRKAGFKPFTVAVNLSSCQFRQKTLIDMVAKALSDYGVEPGGIELELTESILMQNPDEAVKTMRGLKKLGVSISIDDFGTGYSSLSYLQKFPIDTLKIDISFVRNVTTDPGDAAITKTIIALAHSLNLSVIAEGVETEEQMTFLRENGCDTAQGYLVSRPVSAEKITAFFARKAA